MATRVKKPVFLERASYRQRRLQDMARILPVLAAVLFVLPLIWKLTGNDGRGTSDVMIYLFVIWSGLIAIAAILSRRLKLDPESGSGKEEG
ncbi:MAG: hypothetical protein ACO3U1_09820 [Marivivens sp.]|jgi:hypothetical protein